MGRHSLRLPLLCVCTQAIVNLALKLISFNCTSTRNESSQSAENRVMNDLRLTDTHCLDHKRRDGCISNCFGFSIIINLSLIKYKQRLSTVTLNNSPSLCVPFSGSQRCSSCCCIDRDNFRVRGLLSTDSTIMC